MNNTITDETVKEARQTAAQLIEKWDHLSEDEKIEEVSNIVHQLATAEVTDETGSPNEKTPVEEWEEHNESFNYDPPELSGHQWSSEQQQELFDRVISRQIQWFCDRCTGHGPIQTLQRARSHVRNQHGDELIEKHATPAEEQTQDQEPATDGGYGPNQDVETRRENNMQLKEFEET